MSDPVSNAEVEDVLSSIRRLVSEDKRPLQNRPGNTGPDRLVLTPALRIEETEETASRQEGAAPRDTDKAQRAAVPLSEAEKDQGAAQADLAPEEDYSADPYGFDTADDEKGEGDLEAFVEARSGVEPEGGESVTADASSEAEIDRETLSRLIDGQGVEDHQQSVEAASALDEKEGPFDLGQQTQPEADEEKDDLSVLFDEEEAAQSEEDLFTTEEADPQTDRADGAASEPFFAHRSFEDESQDEAAEEGHSKDDQTGRTEALSEKIAQLETAIGNIRDTWEPDGRSEDEYAGTEPPAMAWEDDLPDASDPQTRPHRADYSGLPDEEGEASAEITDDPKPKGATVSDFSKVTGAFASLNETRDEEAASESTETETGLDLGGDEQIIDEAVLRDLVSEIVREELQGALGERITRNVRKLVRREIHRALTAQDLN